MPEVTPKVRTRARTPVFDDRETSDWSSVGKGFEDYVDAFAEHADEEMPDERPSNVQDAPQRMRSWIASKTLLGSAQAESARDLIFFPVVNPNTNNLNRNALQAVLSGRGASADIPDRALSSARSVAERLLEGFDEESSMSAAPHVQQSEDPETGHERSSDPTQSDMNYETRRTPDNFDSIKQVEATPDDDHVAGVVRGYFASFLNEDADGDRFDPQAFDESIRSMGPEAERQRIRHLHAHKADQWLGQPHMLTTDDHGLLFETRILNTRLGNDVMAGYKEDIFEHSVGFIRRGEEQLDDGTVLITKVKLFEGSTVPWGANPATPTTGVEKDFKSAGAALSEMKERADAMRRLLRRGLSEVTEHDVELAVRQLEAAIDALGDVPDAEKGLTVSVTPDNKASVEDGTDLEDTTSDEKVDVSLASDCTFFPSPGGA